MNVLILVYLVLIGTYVIGLAMTLRSAHDRPRPRFRNRHLLTGELHSMPPSAQVDCYDHSPAASLTPDEAHSVMRLHRRCQADSCDHKRAAFRTLVSIGRVVPDVRAERHFR